jgi:hypothetical protein
MSPAAGAAATGAGRSESVILTDARVFRMEAAREAEEDILSWVGNCAEKKLENRSEKLWDDQF